MVKKAISEENAAKPKAAHKSIWIIISKSKILLISFVWLFFNIAMIGVILWLPQYIKISGTELSSMTVGFINMIPSFAIILAVLLWGSHSDKKNERKWHITVAALLAAFGLFTAAFANSLLTAVLFMTLAGLGMGGTQSTIWAAANSFLSPSEAAVGLAFINSAGALGGFIGPYIMGLLVDFTGAYSAGIIIWAVSAFMMAVLIQVAYKIKATSPRTYTSHLNNEISG